MKNYVVYGRFSTDLQNDKSAEDQIASCDERARTFDNWKKIGQYADEGLTGDSTRKRDALRNLLRVAAEGKIDVVMIESLDRLSRRPSEGHYIYEKLQFHDVQIYSLLDNDFLTDMHMAWRTFESSQQLKKVKQNVKRGLIGALGRGVLVGKVPYGYNAVRSADMLKGVREVNEEESAIVQRLYAEYAADVSPVEMIRRLNDEGVPSPFGKKWRSTALFGHTSRTGGILTNPHYRGLFRWGMTQTRRNPDTGAMEPRSADPEQIKEIILPEALRIVDDVVWNAVQDKLATRRRTSFPRRKLPRHLLSGFMFCGVCGNSYVVSASNRYACSGRTELHNCTNRRRVDRFGLEDAVLALLNATLLNPKLLESYIKTYRTEHRRLFGQLDADSAALRKRIEKSEQELERLISAVAGEESSASAKSVLLMAIQRRTEELEKLRSKAQASGTRQRPVYTFDDIVLRLERQLASFQECLSTDNVESARARQTVRTLIDRIVISPTGDDDGRGSGPVAIEVEGRIGAFLEGTDDSSNRVVQLALGIESQLNHATWRASATVKNSDKRRETGPPLHTAEIAEFLTSIPAPVGTDEIARYLIPKCGLVFSQECVQRVTKATQTSLNYLALAGAVVSAKVPGTKKLVWGPAARRQEMWPSGIPSHSGNFTQTSNIMEILRKATTPKTVNDIASQIIAARGERPRKVLQQDIANRIRVCLHFHRRKGTIKVVVFTDTRKQGWLLTEREHELLPSAPPSVEGRLLNGPQVITLLAASSAPMSAREIAKHILSATGDLPTEWNLRLPPTESGSAFASIGLKVSCAN